MTRPVNLEMHLTSQRRPLYRDLTFQVVVGMALGVLVGVLWPISARSSSRWAISLSA
jgi:aerobic C4-dicarboxylate transport protein